MNVSERKGIRTWIEIDTKALAHNYNVLRSVVPKSCKIMSVVKSNAYGHGLLGFSEEMQKLGVDWFGVDSIVEAVALRNNGITKPILVLGYTLPDMLLKAAELDVSITVSTFELLEEIAGADFDKKLKIHVKVDSGMHRQGFEESDMKKVFAELKKLDKKIVVEGLYTHFGAAKNPAFPARTNKQIDLFTKWIEESKKAGHSPITHASASGGTFVFKEAHFDMVRIGISQYGLWPSKEVELYMKDKIDLKPILSWKTLIGEVKKVKKGERVGYDFTEELHRDTVMAICPIGYWHGFPRNLSSIGNVLVHGKRAKLIGRVSMDMINIDLTGIPGVKVGDEVTLIGTDGKDTVSAEEIGSSVENSLYEIITRINPLIKRIYV